MNIMIKELLFEDKGQCTELRSIFHRDLPPPHSQVKGQETPP